MKKVFSISLFVLMLLNTTSCARNDVFDTISNHVESMMPSKENETDTPPDSGIRGNSAGNIINGGYVAIQDDWVYYRIYYLDDDNLDKGYQGGIYKTRIDGTEETQISSDLALFLNVVGDWIYFAECLSPTDFGNIYKIRTDGTEKTQLTFGEYLQCRYICVVEDWIYYTKRSEGIYKMRTDGTEETQIVDGVCLDVTVVGDWIYYVGGGGVSCHKIKTDGTGKKKILGGNHRVTNINVIDAWIYCAITDYDRTKYNGELYKMRTDGTDITRLSENEIDCMNLVDDRIYYSNADDDYSLYMIHTDGTENTKMADSCQNINIVGDWIYYTWGDVYSGVTQYRINIHDGMEQIVFSTQEQ